MRSCVGSTFFGTSISLGSSRAIFRRRHRRNFLLELSIFPGSPDWANLRFPVADYVYNPKEARLRKALRERERSMGGGAGSAGACLPRSRRWSAAPTKMIPPNPSPHNLAAHHQPADHLMVSDPFAIAQRSYQLRAHLGAHQLRLTWRIKIRPEIKMPFGVNCGPNRVGFYCALRVKNIRFLTRNRGRGGGEGWEDLFLKRERTKGEMFWNESIFLRR